jgi:hypothetical protein
VFCFDSIVPSSVLVFLLFVGFPSPLVALPRFFSNNSAIEVDDRALIELLLDILL